MSIIYKRGHVGSLDGIRGVAILLVLTFHCFEKINVYPFNFVSELGWIGVDLFFVLSGFLITGILVDTKGHQGYLSSFFAKRALRIFPLYYLVLTCVFITIAIPGIEKFSPVFDKAHLESSIYYLTFTQNLLFAFNDWGVTDLLNHFWSLAIEEQFYFFWPFLVFYLDVSKLLIVCVLLIIVALVIRNNNVSNDFSYVFTLSRVDALAIGSMLAILIRQQIRILEKVALPLFISTILLLSVICLYSPDLGFRNPYFIRIGYTLFALLFASMIAFVYDTKRIGAYINRFFSLGVLKFFGTYSYGLYIYHWILYKGVYNPLQNRFMFSKAYILVFLVLVTALSVLSFHTFEKYFLKFKTRFGSNHPVSAHAVPEAVNITH